MDGVSVEKPKDENEEGVIAEVVSEKKPEEGMHMEVEEEQAEKAEAEGEEADTMKEQVKTDVAKKAEEAESMEEDVIPMKTKSTPKMHKSGFIVNKSFEKAKNPRGPNIKDPKAKSPVVEVPDSDHEASPNMPMAKPEARKRKASPNKASSLSPAVAKKGKGSASPKEEAKSAAANASLAKAARQAKGAGKAKVENPALKNMWTEFQVPDTFHSADYIIMIYRTRNAMAIRSKAAKKQLFQALQSVCTASSITKCVVPSCECTSTVRVDGRPAGVPHRG